jgi:hypothetical protein
VTVVWRNEINEEVPSPPSLACLSRSLARRRGEPNARAEEVKEEGKEDSSQIHLVLEEDTTLPQPSPQERSLSGGGVVWLN